MAGLGAAFFAGGHLGRGGRLRFEGSLRGRRLQAVFEVAELGFEGENPRFEGHPRGEPNSARRAVGNRIDGRGVHNPSMPDSTGKRKGNGMG